MFREVVRVPGTPPRPGDRGDLAGVIELRILAVQSHVYPTIVFAGITYGFTLFSPTGEQVASWSVTGTVTSAPFSELSITGERSIATAFQQATRLAAWEFTSGFRSVPEERRWLNERVSLRLQKS